jgi:hypothetical protein
MTDPNPIVPLTLESRIEQVFPTLTPEQIAGLAAHGRERAVQRGEVLQEVGEQASRFFASSRRERT